MMFHAAAPLATAPVLGTNPVRSVHPAGRPAAGEAAGTRRLIEDTLQRLRASGLPLQRRLLHAGDAVYRCGEPFSELHVVNSGFFKVMTITADGREQVVGLHFKGDWLGFDGIAGDRYTCDAVALDVGEVWSVNYEALLTASVNEPGLTGMLHAAMSRQMARERESILSLCTLSADARVADFLRQWVEALDRRGLRTDRITLCLTRAEIGNYLGMTLESVSRALSRLARAGVIDFAEKGRRHVQIPDPQALNTYIERSLAPASAALQ
jgi:CRP/FNR family transcriptional regulator